jgi:hypothetical protein
MVKLGYGHGRELNTVLVGSAWIPYQCGSENHFFPVLWIRIRIGFGFNGVPGSGSGSGSRGGKNDPQKLNFFDSLDVLGGGRLLL